MSDIRFNQWLHQSGTGGVSQVASGAVGVGTTNPLADFYVRGDAQITGILTAGHIAMGSSITFGDDDRAYFGDGTDLQIYHSGSDSFIQDTGTGDLKIRSSNVRIEDTSGNLIINASPTTAFLYSSGNAKLGTAGWGAQVNGIFKVLDATDSSGSTNKLSIGTGNDFNLFHDSSHSYISNTTGHLTIQNNVAGHIINLQPKAGANGVITRYEGASELYFNNTKRIETTNTGAVVTGILTATNRVHATSMRIANDNFAAAGNADELILGTTSGNRGLTIVSGNTGIGALFFADDGSTNIGSLVYEHNTNQMRMVVNGGQVMRLDNTSVPTWIYGNDLNTYTSLPAADTIAFTTGGGERLRITAGGNVEIGSGSGTGSDFSLLDGMVINTANGSAGLIINSSSSSHNAYMSFGYGSGSGTSHHDQFSAYIGRVGDNTLIFGTNNSIRARIDSSGNFNLGLSSTPVNSSTEQGVYLAGADSTQSVISSNVTPFVVNRMGTGGNDRNCIEFRNNGSLKGTVGAVGVNNGIFFQSGVTEVMRITSDYKVLVGLTTTGTSTSNNNFELAGTKMLKVGPMYIGYVIGTGNNSNGTLVLHKMGQNQGMQFSGMVTIHSYTGSAYLSGCIVVRYNTDAVTRDVTLQKAQSGANFELVSGTISGESGTYFGIKKNGGGTGSFYINAFVGGNIEAYGGIREVSNSNWTTSTTHFTVT